MSNCICTVRSNYQDEFLKVASFLEGVTGA